jgi:hypothetical protein
VLATQTTTEIEPLLWRLSDIAHVTRLSLRSINRLRASRRMPEPDLVVGRAPCWRPLTIRSWVDGGGLSELSLR